MRIDWTDNFKEVNVKDESYRLRKIMGENQLTLKFSLPEFVDFPLGAYTSFENETYTLYTPPVFKKINESNYDYTLQFASKQQLLSNYKVRDNSGRLVFPYTAKPQEQLQLIVDVLNTYDSGWTIGNYIDSVEKLISFNHNNCLEALQTIAETFNTEWEVVNKVIHLKKVEYFKDTPLALSYGKGNGFVSGVGRQNENNNGGFNVLFVQGGDRNIDLSVYGNKNLLLPKSQELEYEGIIYETDASGLSITKKDTPITFRKEESFDCAHIYPKRTGVISEFITKDLEKHFYDLVDNSIPEDLNFADYMLDGESITVLFESGMLTGREFEANYIHTTRKFEIVPQEYDGVLMPDETFKATIGDKYSVYGMMLPESYVCNNVAKTGASWEMFAEACKYFYENGDAKFTFRGKLDGIWAKSDWVNIGGKIKVGSYIEFSDTVFQPTGINIRIVGVKDFINNPYSPEIELANSVQGSNILSELGRVTETNEVVAQVLQQEAIAYTKRRFRDTLETISMLESAQLGFGDTINPLAVNAMSLLVGDKSLQFRFVNTSLDEITHVFTYDNEAKQLTTSAGKLQHLTLEIDAIKPNPIYKVWDMSSYTSAVLSETDKSYFLYAKVSKLNNTGEFLLTENSIALEEVTDYYHLLVGILNKEFQGERSFVKMYGFTEILPGQIKVNKLSSTDGSQYIELQSGRVKIRGRVEFENTSPAYYQVAAQQDPKIATAESTAKAYADAQANLAEVNAKAYADGELTTLETLLIAEAQAKANLAETQAKAYADGIVSAEEARAISDAQAKADLAELNAKNYADAQANLAEVQAKAYADGELTTLETLLIADAQAKANLAETNAKAYADGELSSLEIALIADAQAKADLAELNAKAYADGEISATEAALILEAEAKANLAEINAKAYADGEISAEEARAIADAEAKLLQATNYADSIGANLQNQLDTTNSGLSAAEQAVIEVEEKTSFIATDINGNIIATGTLLTGADGEANGGITGLGGENGIQIWAGSTFANKENAPVRIYRNGNVKFSKTDADGGIEYDSEGKKIVLYHPNGEAGIILQLENGMPKIKFLKNNGEEVFSMGENGIYYISEVAESYTETDLRFISTYPEAATEAQFNAMRTTIGDNLCKQSDTVYNVSKTMTAYLYQAGMNIYSNLYRQYEGYKLSELRTDNVSDGWYCLAGPLFYNFSNGSFSKQITYVSNGSITTSLMLTNIVPNQNTQDCV